MWPRTIPSRHPGEMVPDLDTAGQSEFIPAAHQSAGSQSRDTPCEQGAGDIRQKWNKAHT